MSRYELKPLNPNHTVTIGGDSPLSNFFLHVFDKSRPSRKPEQPMVWLGAEGYGTQRDVDRVLDVARQYAHVHPRLRDRLVADRRMCRNLLRA